MNPHEKEGKVCVYCDGSGEIEMDNNGPIVPCPVCEVANPSEERLYEKEESK